MDPANPAGSQNHPPVCVSCLLLLHGFDLSYKHLVVGDLESKLVNALDCGIEDLLEVVEV